MIAFVILHYQVLEETKNCIQTIKEKINSPKHIIIVDNASPNGSGTALDELFKNDTEVTVILSKKNLGFANGNNLGYKKAREFKPDFIVVMNNDVFLTQNDFSERLYQAYNDYHFDVLGPDIYSTKTSLHQNPQRQKNYTLEELKKDQRKLSFNNRFKFLIRLKYLLVRKSTEIFEQAPDYDIFQENVPLHGAIYIFSSSFIETHDNCFYPKTFMYYESYILHYLGMKENLKFIYDPSIKVIHHEDVSTNQTYNKLYKKVLFVNKYLLDSCNIFIDLMENNGE